MAEEPLETPPTEYERGYEAGYAAAQRDIAARLGISSPPGEVTP